MTHAVALADYDSRLTRDKRETSSFIAAVYEARPARCLVEVVQPSRRRPASRESGCGISSGARCKIADVDGWGDKPVCSWKGLPTDLFVQHSFRQKGFL